MCIFFKRKKPALEPRYICTDEEFIYGPAGDKYHKTIKHMLAKDRNDVLLDCLKLISTTVYPKTFFGRYNEAISEAKIVIRLSVSARDIEKTCRILDMLYDDKVSLVNAFFDRCNAAGKLFFMREEILKYRSDIPDESYSYFTSLIRAEIDENDHENYIFCSVVFSDNEKPYYYLARENNLKIGDSVHVPVGKENREEIAQIVNIEIFKGNEAPFPIKLLKYIY